MDKKNIKNMHITIKTFLIMITILTSIACTPEIRNQYHKEVHAAKNYHYKDTFRAISGIDDAFPTPQQIKAKQSLKDCIKETNINRTVTNNGVNDEIGYLECTNSLPPSHQPQRMEGRPGTGL